MAAQILTVLIKTNKTIKGIKCNNEEFKVVQFADDTTLLLNGMTQSLQAALNTIEIFGSFSGLKVNMGKTQIVWIGKKKYSKEKVTVRKCILNAVTTFKLLGINFCVDLEKCGKLNFPEKVRDIKETINKWNRRYLTPLGKITVIKTLLMSKLNHAFSTLPDPEDKLIKEINDIFFKFIWSNKPAKINREVVTLDKNSGADFTKGLKSRFRLKSNTLVLNFVKKLLSLWS